MSRVLVVEDSKTMAALLLSRIQMQLGFEVDLAENGSRATELLEVNQGREAYFIAVLDLNLPDISPVQIVETVRSQGVPCLVLTGEYDPDLRKQILEKHVVDYVSKGDPNCIEQALSIIRRIHKNRDIKILVVDDSTVYNEHMATLLGTQLFQVLRARTGEEALGLLEANPDVRMVLTDNSMPGIDGLELTRRIRRKYQKDRMAILALSGADEAEITPRFLKQGANDFIVKPFSPEEFMCRINLNIEIIEMMQHLQIQAHRDFLTGLYNRRYFFDRAGLIHKEALAGETGSIALAMLDLDGFKSINDTHGHEAGDQVIKEAARVMQENSKGKDIIARMGGEEFCILFRDSTREDAIHFFESLRRQMEERIVFSGRERIRFTISIGLCTEMMDTVELMIQKADQLLYQAKAEGRNRLISC